MFLNESGVWGTAMVLVALDILMDEDEKALMSSEE
jgi:hypothetical protein